MPHNNPNGQKLEDLEPPNPSQKPKRVWIHQIGRGTKKMYFFLCFDSMPINQHVNSCCVVDVFQSLLIPLLPNMIVIDQIRPRLVILEEHNIYYETLCNLRLVIH
jgi:hypothetical protein